MCGFQKQTKQNKNFRFWEFLTILAQNFGQISAQNVQFSSFLKKQKRHFFTLPKTSIRANKSETTTAAVIPHKCKL